MRVPRTVTALVGLMLTVHCGARTPLDAPTAEREAPFVDPRVCYGPTATDWIGALRGQIGVDYLELRRSDLGGVLAIEAKSGNACATARNVKSCRYGLADQTPADEYAITGCRPFSCESCRTKGRYFALTRGEDAQTVNTQLSLHELLGSLDTPEKLLGWVLARGYDVECTKPWMRSVEGGYDVRALRAPGCLSQAIELRVFSDGKICEGEEDAGCSP